MWRWYVRIIIVALTVSLAARALPAAAASFYALVVADTDDFNAGPAIAVGKDHVAGALNGIGNKLKLRGLKSQIKVIDGSNFSLEEFNRTLEGILSRLTKDDTFVFYYIGHGRNENGHYYPFLIIPGQNAEGITLDEVADKVDAAKPRLAILIAEACNRFDLNPRRQIMAEGSSDNAVLQDAPVTDVIAQLFAYYSGSITVSSAAPGQFAGASQATGPFFTSRLLSVLRVYLNDAALNHVVANWKDVLSRATKPIDIAEFHQTPLLTVQDLRFRAPASVDVSGPEVPVSASFRAGAADRRDWEQWFSGLVADFRAGADFWAGQRSLPQPGSCYGPDGQTLGDWTSGCLAAKQRLSVTDLKRRSDAEYKSGWNSL